MNLLALVLSGCVTETKWETVSVEDEGDVCLYTGDFDPWSTSAGGSESAFTADAPITVDYLANYCFSSSCTRNLDIACDVQVSGNAVTIHGTGTWEEAVNPSECTADCGLGSAQCTLDPLPEGTYDVTFGDDSETLVIPSTATPCLEG